MPYIPGGGRISDVYHSGNVFSNNVQIALWRSPGGSSSFPGVEVEGFEGIPKDSPVEPYLNSATTATTQANTQALIAAQVDNPSGPNQFYNSNANFDGVKGNYIPAEDGSTATGIISTLTSASSIVDFLTQTLEEANRGLWRETGQGGAASNPNITGIWSNLGYSGPPWNSDQTAWCMGFVNFALKRSGYQYVQTASAAAITQNPGRWNAVQIPKDQAQPGDIAFWSYRHVNFVYTANNGRYSFVGGNQSPKASNNPNDGDVTQSWPNGTSPNNPTWVSCFRLTKS